jgi:hypothetical protein
MKFNLIVLKSKDIDATKKFYESTSINFVEEKHGDGPRHYSSIINDVVLEIYPTTVASESATIGFCVNDLDDIKSKLISAGGMLIAEASQEKPYLVIRDIDGRTVIFTPST